MSTVELVIEVGVRGNRQLFKVQLR